VLNWLLKTNNSSHLGHFILTMTLFPLLQSTAALPGSDVRVVTVSSGAHKFAKVVTRISTKEDLNETFAAEIGNIDSVMAKQSRYAFTKALNVLFASEMQRYADALSVPLVSLSVNPGVVGTSGALDLWPTWFQPIVRYLAKSPLQGASTLLFAAVSWEVAENRTRYAGAYLDPPGKIGKTSKMAGDERLAKSLWSLSDTIMKEVLEQNTD
jgi:NAD(P)-dependent dehydrogenase (short-subunit alcohol dehydrogenase family)